MVANPCSDPPFIRMLLVVPTLAAASPVHNETEEGFVGTPVFKNGIWSTDTCKGEH